MATCACGTVLEGRRRKCDACKAGATPAPKPAAKKPAAKKTTTRKAAAKKPAKKSASPKPAESVSSAPSPVDELGSRGRALWTSLAHSIETPAGQLALEVCRSADRLDELDRIVAGKGVLRLMIFRLGDPWYDDGGDQHVHVTVGFQSVLAEVRQQQATFAAMLTKLGLEPAGESEKGEKEATPLAQVLALVQSGAVPSSRSS